MNETDFFRIEKELNIILTEIYKKLMLNYPFSEDKYEFQRRTLINETDTIIRLNNEYRINGFKNKEWKHNFFIFGVVSDMVYFIDLNDNNDIIYSVEPKNKYNPENIKNLISNDSFNDFIDFRKMLQDIIDNP